MDGCEFSCIEGGRKQWMDVVFIGNEFKKLKERQEIWGDTSAVGRVPDNSLPNLTQIEWITEKWSFLLWWGNSESRIRLIKQFINRAWLERTPAGCRGNGRIMTSAIHVVDDVLDNHSSHWRMIFSLPLLKVKWEDWLDDSWCVDIDRSSYRNADECPCFHEQGKWCSNFETLLTLKSIDFTSEGMLYILIKIFKQDNIKNVKRS